MLDDLHAGPDGLPDGARRVGMDGDVGAPVLGGLDRGPDLGFGVLGRFDRIVRRADAAAPHHLDLARPQSQLLARAQPDLVRAVGNGSETLELGVAERAARCPRQLEREAKVAMARGLRDDGAGRIDARTDADAFVDGALQPGHGTAEVAHRREAPHQGRLGLSRRQQMEVRGLGRQQERHGRCRHEGMPVRVDEARHQHPPVRRDDVDVIVRVDGDGARGNPLDDVAPHQHVRRSRERGAPAIEDADILKERRSAPGGHGRKCRSRRFLRLSRLAKRHGEARQHQPATWHLAYGRRRQEQARPAHQTCTPLRRARCGLGGMHGSSRPPGRAGPRGRP